MNVGKMYHCVCAEGVTVMHLEAMDLFYLFMLFKASVERRVEYSLKFIIHS